MFCLSVVDLCGSGFVGATMGNLMYALRCVFLCVLSLGDGGSLAEKMVAELTTAGGMEQNK